MKPRILVIDDEYAMRDSIQMALRGEYEVDCAESGREGLEKFSAGGYHVVLTDLKMPDVDGIRVLEEVKRMSPETPCLMITAYGSVETAVEAMKKGAHDFIQKPFRLDELVMKVRRALEMRTLSVENESLRAMVGTADYVWGRSAVMQQLMELIRRVAESDRNVLVCGESGAGKEVVSRILHQCSPRGQGPFLTVNCAALSAGLLESELFGHERGAFTGADRMRRGRFELAEGGSLLLDEISEIDPHLQAKLLRVAQEKTYERVGSSQTRRADVRIIATTNRDLKAEVRAGRFRQDLYFRLTEFEIRVPPLREHREDIPDLVKFYARGKKFSDSAMRALMEYAWPGNIRELRNVVERAVVLARADTITREMIQPWLGVEEALVVGPGKEAALAALVGMSLQEIEERLIDLNLKHFGGNRQKTAQALGITPRTLQNKLRKKTP